MIDASNNPLHHLTENESVLSFSRFARRTPCCVEISNDELSWALGLIKKGIPFLDRIDSTHFWSYRENGRYALIDTKAFLMLSTSIMF